MKTPQYKLRSELIFNLKSDPPTTTATPEKVSNKPDRAKQPEQKLSVYLTPTQLSLPNPNSRQSIEVQVTQKSSRIQ